MKTVAARLAFVFFFLYPYPASGQDTLCVYYLNVGQADAIYIQCPTKEHTMLIDAADTRYPESAFRFQKELKKLTGGLKKKIDVVVASHNHADHLGSMKWVLEHYDVVRFLDNGHNPGTALYKNIMTVVKKQVKKHELEYLPLNKAGKDFVDFCPDAKVNAEIIQASGAYKDCKNQNDCSVIVRLEYLKTSFLFVGDAEKELEKEILNDPIATKEIDTDVLKAGHHGSTTSSTLDFIKAVSPELVVVSCGKKGIGTNVGYKHPQLASLTNFNSVLTTEKYRTGLIEVYDYKKAKWTKKKAKEGIYYTKVDGNVAVLSDGEHVWKK